jgi:hypothetical protein
LVVAIALLCSGPTRAQAQDSDSGTAPIQLQAEPAELDLVAGQVGQVSVTARDADGQPVEVDLRWAAPRGSVSASDGVIRGLAPGAYEVVVTAVQGGGAPAMIRIPVRVRWPAIERVEIVAGPLRLYEGTQLPLSARAFHADGSERPEIRPSWTTSDPAVATVDQMG